MELNQPNVKLVRKLGADNKKTYSVYAVTVMDHSQYVPLPFNQTTFSKNTEGHYQIVLKVSKDESLPVNKHYLKHVTHVVQLSGLDLKDSDILQVEVKEGNQKVGESGPLHVMHSDEDGKPIPVLTH